MKIAYHPAVTRARFDALAVGASLMLSFGLLSHLLVEAVATAHRLELITRSHAILTALSLLALAWSLARLTGNGAPRERRRRLALVRAALQVDSPGFFVALALAQAAIAAGILRLEGITIAPEHMLAALVSGVLAIAAGTLALHLARRRAIVILTSWVHANESTPSEHRIGLRPAAPRTIAAIPFLRSLPDRAPPEFLTA